MWGNSDSERTTSTQSLPAATEAALRRRLAGTVLTPSDEGYDSARQVWNGLVNRYPSAIVRCQGVTDVVAAVDVAREVDLPVCVRGGGHHVAGNGVVDDGVVIDLSPMDDVRVDPEARRARVGPGARLGDLLRETQAFGLAAPTGTSADVGVAGSTLGGGVGWLRRKHGLGIDALRSVDVVTADGECLTASESRNEDLFWALRGGGWTVGVVTSFEFELYPVGPDVATVTVFYDDVSDTLRAYREWADDAPDEATSMAFCTAAPDDATPEAARGEPAIGIAACYAGPVEEGERALRPLREIGDPLVDYSEVTTFRDLHDLGNAYPHGRRYYWKSHLLDDLTDECVEAIRSHAAATPSPRSSVTVWQLGGAMGRVPVSATAFAGRDAAYMVSVEASWDDPTANAANLSWARDAWSDLGRFSTGGMYVNFAGLGEEGEDIVRAGTGSNYERLREVKARYDPENRFRFNQLVRGDGESEGE